MYDLSDLGFGPFFAEQLFDDDGLDSVFREITALSGRCRFKDCRHETEPGCAVRAAIASGAGRGMSEPGRGSVAGSWAEAQM